MDEKKFLTVAPEHLHSLKRICDRFRKRRETVLAWYAEGAPIAYCDGSYCAEYNALMAWLAGKGKIKR